MARAPAAITSGAALSVFAVPLGCCPDNCIQPAWTAIIDPKDRGTFWLQPPAFTP